MHAGRILGLWRYPVKSMRGEPVTDARLSARGLGGDRVQAVYDGRSSGVRRLTAREAPDLLAWSARYPDAPGSRLEPAMPPMATVESPAGETWTWDDPELPAALAAALGRPVHLRRDMEGIYDVPRTVLITTEASRRSLEDELGAPVDVRRFRPNLHLELDEAAWADLAWAGSRLELADGAALEPFKPCRRCVIPTRDVETRRKWPQLLRQLEREHALSFGIYARVISAGTISVGDEVRLSADPAAARR